MRQRPLRRAAPNRPPRSWAPRRRPPEAMLRAIKAAFLLRWPIKGLGYVPVNVVALACLGALGFGNHGFWLAGTGLDTLYLPMLVSNRRFLNWVAAQDKVVEDGSVARKLKTLVDQLAPDS